MIKKMFILLFLLLIIVYLIIAVTTFNAKPEEQTCEGMELVINDSIDYGFITQKEILRLLTKDKISPIGKKMNEINTRQLEDALKEHPLIGEVECFRIPNGKVGIEVTQRIPILRIMASNGDNYYLDKKGVIMPTANNAANVAIVTGYVDRNFAQKELYEFGMFLKENPFWNAQIQQINVTASKELELVPRVGEHIIFMGKPGNYENKFDRLKTFYKKGLNQVGWNKYSRISLEFENQIICTKKEK
ncbi:MAG: cell division protein FtsQ [Bacteroidaceae bacterium]|nr:cell division protein FtsQ [Bacteroidaceae bacterium]